MRTSCLKKLAVLALLAGGLSLHAAAPFVRVFVLSGQSNMGGGNLPVALTGAASDVWYDNSTGGQAADTLQTAWKRVRMLDENPNGGVQGGAARALAQRFPDDRLAIVKVSQGATGIDYWTEPGQLGYERLMERITAVRARLDAQVAASEISGYAFEGFFWMQGEAEINAYIDRGVLAYLGSLHRLLDAVEERSATPGLPSVIGRVSWLYAPETIRPNTPALPGSGQLREVGASGRPYLAVHEYVNTGVPRGGTLYQGYLSMVRGAHQFFGMEAGRVSAWAETDDLHVTDYFHFSNDLEGSAELGLRMARAWMRLHGDTVTDELRVDAGPHRWAHPGTIAFTPALSGLDGETATVLWEQLYGPAAVIATPARLDTTVTLTTPGTYAFRVAVRTPTRKHRHTVNVIVYPETGNLPAYGYAEPLYVEAPLQRVPIRATLFNPDSDPLSLNWQRQLGGAEVVIENPGQLETHARFHAPGAYTLRLAVDDGTPRADGNSSGWVLLPVVVGTGNDAEFFSYTARWSFDEAGYPLGEIFATGIDQTHAAVTTTAAAQVGAGAGAFSGAAHLQIDRNNFTSTYPHSGPAAISFAAWIQPDQPGTGTQVIYDQGGGTNAFTLRLHNGMLQLGFRANSGSVVIAETTAPAAAEWTHVTAVANTLDQSLRLYLNGAQAVAVTHAGVLKPGTMNDAAALGARLNSDAFSSGTGAADFFTGLLDEARVYLTALDPQRIETLALDPALLLYNAWADTIDWAEGDDPSPQGVVNAAGVSNLLAYALNIDPTDPAISARLPVAATGLSTGGQRLLHLTTRQRTGAHRLTYAILASHDLQAWGPVAAPPVVLDPDCDGDGSTARVRYSVPVPSDATPVFLRLSVTTD